jgi:hypothetical protein
MSAAELIVNLQENNRKRGVLIDQLRMWEDVKAQGIDPETVESFTLREAWIPKAEQAKRRLAARLHQPDAYVGPRGRLKHYNAVKLKDGSYRQLEPPVRAPLE